MLAQKRPVPSEVSSWMEKDLALGELTAATRFITADARQNQIVSRRFFSDLLTLSFERYRKIMTSNFEKNNFLRNQRLKSETSMPGLRPYVEQLIFESDGIVSGGSSSAANKNDGNHLTSPSTQSLFHRPETKSDLTFNRRPQSSIPRIKTAQTVKSQPEMPTDFIPIKPLSQRPLTGIETSRDRANRLTQPRKSHVDITPIIASKKLTHQRPVSRHQISRERLDYLAQPKSYRFKSAGTNPVRSNAAEPITTSEDVPGEFDKISHATISRMQSAHPDKAKSTVRDERFQQLIEIFSEVHEAKTSPTQTVKSVIAGNASLQDEKGRWRTIRPTVANSKPTFRNRRQTLADKMNNKLDVFLIDVGA